jgi:hypothetical protein
LPELYAAAVLIGLATIAVSTLTFVWIEKPFFYSSAKRDGLSQPAAVSGGIQ